MLTEVSLLICEVFQNEPVTIKGVKNFRLKEVANKMAEYKFINKPWEDGSSIGNGIGAMMKAASYYKQMGRLDREKDKNKYESLKKDMKTITRYNEGDCKAVYEIVNYLRSNHCGKSRSLVEYDSEEEEISKEDYLINTFMEEYLAAQSQN